MDLNKLIKKCIKCDRKSQKEFYMLTSDRLMNISRRYSSDINEAKDILQNAYIKIFKSLNQFDMNKGNLDAWLSKIVINEALQMMRKKKTLKSNMYEMEFENISAPEVMSRLQAEDILKLMKRLPEGYRIILNMYIVEGYSHKEISEALGIKESSSRSQLVRARAMLKELIIEQKKTELC